MGASQGKAGGGSNQIEKYLQKQKAIEDSKIKLLLLGAGESGKSTLFKQMKILYSKEKDFTIPDRNVYRGVIHQNIITDFKIMIKSCATKSLEFADQDQDLLKTVESWQRGHTLTEQDKEVLLALWKTKTMEEAWDKRADVQVQDALEYYMNPDTLSKVCSPEYLPTNDDILHSRVRTSGVATESFRMGQATFEMYDVGGQRNERRKWLHAFENVTAVIFVAAISEYDQVLFEDDTTNRQDEAVELFKQQLHSKWFTETPFILFLNKQDLFREKLAKYPFKVTDGPRTRNTDYTGATIEDIDDDAITFEDVYEDTVDYLTQLYIRQRNGSKFTSNIYPHVINSTDTSNIDRIMNTCKDIILRENLKRGGWYLDSDGGM